MKITLTFDTEQDEEFNLHKTYIKAVDMSLAIYDILQLLRSERKYAPDSMSEETYKKVKEIEDKVHEIISQYDLYNIIHG